MNINFKNIDFRKLTMPGIHHVHVYHDAGCPASDAMGGNGSGCTCSSVDVASVSDQQHLAHLYQTRAKRRAAERAMQKALKKAKLR